MLVNAKRTPMPARHLTFWHRLSTICYTNSNRRAFNGIRNLRSPRNGDSGTCVMLFVGTIVVSEATTVGSAFISLSTAVLTNSCSENSCFSNFFCNVYSIPSILSISVFIFRNSAPPILCSSYSCLKLVIKDSFIFLKSSFIPSLTGRKYVEEYIQQIKIEW